MNDSRPHPDFAHDIFHRFIGHFEHALNDRFDYAVVDQFGSVNGRLHMHGLLAGTALDQTLREPLEEWLQHHAGSSRVLPFTQGAAYYIARFLGRDVTRCDWDVRVGEQKMEHARAPETFGEVVAVSAEMPKSLFHQGLPGRHK